MSIAFVTSKDPKGRHLLAIAAKVYDRAELTAEEAQLLNERGGEFAAGMFELLTRLSKRAPDYAAACRILGPDFITPEEISAARSGVVYNPKQLLDLGNTVPGADALEWCRDNDFTVVAGPPRPMSPLDIRDLQPSYFYSETGGWLDDPSELFAQNDKVTCRWLLIRKKPVPGSTNKTWDEQIEPLSYPEVVPNAAEQLWTITTYKAVRGISLLPSTDVRTSSVSSLGEHVRVGNFAADGIDICGTGDLWREPYIGLSSSRNP